MLKKVYYHPQPFSPKKKIHPFPFSSKIFSLNSMLVFNIYTHIYAYIIINENNYWQFLFTKYEIIINKKKTIYYSVLIFLYEYLPKMYSHRKMEINVLL